MVRFVYEIVGIGVCGFFLVADGLAGVVVLTGAEAAVVRVDWDRNTLSLWGFEELLTSKRPCLAKWRAVFERSPKPAVGSLDYFIGLLPVKINPERAQLRPLLITRRTLPGHAEAFTNQTPILLPDLIPHFQRCLKLILNH